MRTENEMATVRLYGHPDSGKTLKLLLNLDHLLRVLQAIILHSNVGKDSSELGRICQP